MLMDLDQRAEAVVDRLEVVQVDQQDDDLAADAPGPAERGLYPVDEQRAVWQAGEAVVEGLMAQLRCQVVPFAQGGAQYLLGLVEFVHLSVKLAEQVRVLGERGELADDDEASADDGRAEHPPRAAVESISGQDGDEQGVRGTDGQIRQPTVRAPVVAAEHGGIPPYLQLLHPCAGREQAMGGDVEDTDPVRRPDRLQARGYPLHGGGRGENHRAASGERRSA